MHRHVEAESAKNKVTLQYWSSFQSVTIPETWPEPYAFANLEEAMTFAMTQSPAGRELAWLRTAEGRVLTAEQIRRAIEQCPS